MDVTTTATTITPPPPPIPYQHQHQNQNYKPTITTITTNTPTKNTFKYSNPTSIGIATLTAAVTTTTTPPPPPLYHHHYKYHQLKQHNYITTNTTNNWYIKDKSHKPYIQRVPKSANTCDSDLLWLPKGVKTKKNDVALAEINRGDKPWVNQGFWSIFYRKITRYFWFRHILSLVIYQTPLSWGVPRPPNPLTPRPLLGGPMGGPEGARMRGMIWCLWPLCVICFWKALEQTRQEM